MSAFTRLLLRWISPALQPRMRYGLRCSSGAWRQHSRISTNTVVEGADKWLIGDHVFIGHHNFVDASAGLTIEDGVQITNHVSVLTHSSHRALRLERDNYWGHPDPAGLQRRATHIGAWSFIGPHCTIAPGTRIGRGVLVRSHSFVQGDVPDFAIVQGQPATAVGDVRDGDRAWMQQADVPQATRAAYEAWVLALASTVGSMQGHSP